MAITLKKSNGDLVLQASNGRPYYIDGIEKLSQDCADALMTDYNSDRQFGSELADLDKINRPGVLGVFSRGFIMQRVRDALERLRALQNKRPDQLTSFEAIDTIGQIRVFQTSKTGYVFWVTVEPVSGPDTIPISFAINLSHQLLSSTRAGAPGTKSTDVGRV